MAEQGSTGPVDVAALVADIETTVARRRAAGEYPAELLERLHADFSPQDGAEPPETLALIQSARPLRSSKPILGPAIVAAKKVVRRLLAWYVHPIAHDQTRFNDAIVRDLRSLERRLSRVETEATPASTWGKALAPGRAAQIVAALVGIPPGPVLVIGADAALREELGDRIALLDYAGAAPLERLATTASDSLSGVVLAGLLPRLSATELIAVMPAVARVMRHSGRMVCDFPDGDALSSPLGATAVDVTMQRWLRRPTVELLIEAAALQALNCDKVDADPVSWLTIAAERPSDAG